jgi:vacuolar-type H+-ATPase subunit F/Vma7
VLTDREIVAGMVLAGMTQAQAQRQLKERDEHIRLAALRSKARRDRFAIATLHALLVKSAPDSEVKPADFAQGAVAQADALIAELDK